MKSHKAWEIILTLISQRLLIHNPLATFPRFLDPTTLVNRMPATLNEISLSSPPIFHSTRNLATSLVLVPDQYPGIGKKQKSCTITINQLSHLSRTICRIFLSFLILWCYFNHWKAHETYFKIRETQKIFPILYSKSYKKYCLSEVNLINTVL